MKYSLFFAATAAVISIAGASPAPAPIEPNLEHMNFDCNDIPSICANMCYGVYCLGNSRTLEYDKPNAAKKRERRKAAGCIASGGNRCSVKKGAKKGQQCDEYPFASSKTTGGVEERVNRCVPAGENRKQGGLINAFYRRVPACKDNPTCKFIITFGNPGNHPLCRNPKDNEKICKDEKKNEASGPGGKPNDNDKAEDGTDDDGGNPEPEAKRSMTLLPRYRLSSGEEMEFADEAIIGRRIWSVKPRNATLFELQARSHEFDPDDEDDEYDYMLENLEVRDDVIVERIR